MVRVNDTLSSSFPKVWLQTFLTCLNLLVSHRLYLAPLVCEDMIIVDGVLPIILRSVFQDEPFDQVWLKVFFFETWLCFEIEREDKLRVIQDTLVNERSLHH